MTTRTTDLLAGLAVIAVVIGVAGFAYAIFPWPLLWSTPSPPNASHTGLQDTLRLVVGMLTALLGKMQRERQRSEAGDASLLRASSYLVVPPGVVVPGVGVVVLPGLRAREPLPVLTRPFSQADMNSVWLSLPSLFVSASENLLIAPWAWVCERSPEPPLKLVQFELHSAWLTWVPVLALGDVVVWAYAPPAKAALSAIPIISLFILFSLGFGRPNRFPQNGKRDGLFRSKVKNDGSIARYYWRIWMRARSLTTTTRKKKVWNKTRAVL
jgi:hypothetical protein